MWWHQRLAIVRGFARYLQASDPRHEVPPVNLLSAKFRRAVPYLYSEAEIEALMRAAGRIRSPLNAATYQTLIGLLSVTGMRIGEAIALDRADVELPEGRLTVRRGKHGRSREVALHATTVTALDAYARLRDEFCPRVKDPSFLITNTGMRLHKRTIGNEFLSYTFRPRLSKNKYGKHFLNFTPAVSSAAKTRMRREMRRWRVNCRSDKTLTDLALMFNRQLQGWLGRRRGAVSALRLMVSSPPPAEPDLRIPTHPALHRTSAVRCLTLVGQRRSPAG